MMMRESEYIVIAPRTDHVLERVSGELIKRHMYVEALWVAEHSGQAVCRLVTDDEDGAIAAIAAAGYAVSSVREVLVDRFPDEPGVLAAISRLAAEAGVKLASAYPGSHGDLVLASDDLNALEAAIVERPSGGGI
jgi:hypothetical protein